MKPSIVKNKKHTINENIFSSLAGGLMGTAGDVSGAMPRSGVADFGAKGDKLAKKTFTDRFVRRAKDALNTAVNRGLIDLRAKMSKPEPGAGGLGAGGAGGLGAGGPGGPGAGGPGAGGPGGPGAGGPGGPGAGGAGAGGPGAGGAKTSPVAKPQVDVNVDAAVKAMRTFQPTGTKPLPAKFTDELNKDLQYVSKNKDYLLRAAEKIQKFNGAGYNMQPFYKSFMSQYALGKKQQTIQEERLQELYLKLITEDSLVEELRNRGYDTNILIKNIEDLFERYYIGEVSPQGGGRVSGAGLSQTPNAVRKRQARAAAKAGAAQPAAQPAAKAGAAQPAAQPAAKAGAAAPTAASAQSAAKKSRSKKGGTSLGDWLKANFISSFLQGVNWKSGEKEIDKILASMPKKWPNIDNELAAIADIGWSLSPKLYDVTKAASRY